MLIDLKNATKECGQDKAIQSKTTHAMNMWERCPPLEEFEHFFASERLYGTMPL